MRFEELGNLTLAPKEVTTLYRILKPLEAELRGEEERLLERIEKTLYQGLSIEEMEKLEEEIRNER